MFQKNQAELLLAGDPCLQNDAAMMPTAPATARQIGKP
jgi:hypothetical protein